MEGMEEDTNDQLLETMTSVLPQMSGQSIETAVDESCDLTSSITTGTREIEEGESAKLTTTMNSTRKEKSSLENAVIVLDNMTTGVRKRGRPRKTSFDESRDLSASITTGTREIGEAESANLTTIMNVTRKKRTSLENAVIELNNKTTSMSACVVKGSRPRNNAADKMTVTATGFRKRGRPRKTSADETDEMTTSMTNDVKRGRPRKTSVDESDEMTSVMTAGVRKRGRPRKTSVVESDDMATAMTAGVPKRGRPRKISADEADEMTSVTTVVRKRGRPSKTSADESCDLTASITTGTREIGEGESAKLTTIMNSTRKERSSLENAVIELDNMTTVVRKRGRPRKTSFDESRDLTASITSGTREIEGESVNLTTIMNVSRKKRTSLENAVIELKNMTTSMNAGVVKGGRPSNNATDITTAMATGARKRGRPKKCTDFNITLLKSEGEESDLPNRDSVVGWLKSSVLKTANRKRGRPKKIGSNVSIKSETDDHVVSYTSSELQPYVRKRGRPWKTNTSDFQKSKTVFRKRGRPSKTPTSDFRKLKTDCRKRGWPKKIGFHVSIKSETEDHVEGAQKLQPYVRKRGRPRKSLNSDFQKLKTDCRKRGRPSKVSRPVLQKIEIEDDFTKVLDTTITNRELVIRPQVRKRGRPKKITFNSCFMKSTIGVRNGEPSRCPPDEPYFKIKTETEDIDETTPVKVSSDEGEIVPTQISEDVPLILTIDSESDELNCVESHTKIVDNVSTELKLGGENGGSSMDSGDDETQN